MRVRGNCLKYLKRGWNRTEGRGHKYFKKGGGGKLGQGVDALKRGAGTPLRTTDTVLDTINIRKKSINPADHASK